MEFEEFMKETFTEEVLKMAKEEYATILIGAPGDDFFHREGGDWSEDGYGPYDRHGFPLTGNGTAEFWFFESDTEED